MFSRYNLFLFLLTQLIWVVPTCSRFNPRFYSPVPPGGHRDGPLIDRLSAKRDATSKPTVAATWYAGWHSTDYTLEDISWDKYTHVIYAFA